MAFQRLERLLVIAAAILLCCIDQGTGQTPGTGAISGVVLDPANLEIDGRLTNFDRSLALKGPLPATGVLNGYVVASNNLTNTPQFGNRNTNLGYPNPLLPAVAGPGFGQILSEQGRPHPRIIQLVAKVLF
jgi:hypothetical protein